MAIDAQAALVGVDRRGGANAFASGLESLRDPLAAALRRVSGRETGDISAIVVGLAGVLARSESNRAVGRLVAELGYRADVLVVNDAEAMFASGTSRRHGHVLVAGTGAIAMAIRESRATAVVDGHGWLLGDEGSAVWIGVEALRAVLRASDGRAEQTSLTKALPSYLEVVVGRPLPTEPRAVVAIVHDLPPSTLGELALVVDREAQGGDQVAQEILAAATTTLTETLAAAIERGGGQVDLPIVLGGSVVHENRFVRDGLEAAARGRWPRASLAVVQGGAAGAALWARRLAGADHDEDALHRLAREIETTRLDPSLRN